MNTARKTDVVTGRGPRRYVPRPEASSLASLAAGSLTLKADSRSDMAAALWRTLDSHTAAVFPARLAGPLTERDEQLAARLGQLLARF